MSPPPVCAARGSARPHTTATHCPYCSLQCGITLRTGDGPAQVVPADFPTNRGALCPKGWSAAELLDHPERLRRPLVRAVAGDRASPLVESSWEEALQRLVGAVHRAQDRYGPDAVGCFGGGSLTNEQAYQLGKFARVALRTRAIDYNGRFCMSSAAGAAVRAFGLDRGLPFPLSDIAGADVVVLVGSNPAETMPPAMQWFDAGRARGAQHIVVDPRRTATARAAALHLQVLPGTDLALANGLLHIAISEGLLDEAYVAARTTGFDAARAGVASYWPDRVERLTGVPVADQRRTVFALARARNALVLTARGAEQHRSGTDTVQAWINLALALGLPGRPGSGWGTVTGQANGQGGREHGQKADQLPGYRSLTDPVARALVAGVWGVDPDQLPGPGPSAVELLDALGRRGGVRVLLVLAANLAVSAPDARHVTSRLADLDFLAVSDFFVSETAELADVVLPSAMWAEEDGTMTNLEGRVIRRRRSLAPPEGVRDDLALLAELAARLGVGDKFSADPERVFDELRRASTGGVADYAGISYQRIDDEQGVFWPCPSPEHPGTPRLFTERFATPDGRARFVRVDHVPAHEEPDRDFPYVLTTGRVLAQYQSGTQTRRSPSLQLLAPVPRAEMHPDLARRHGIGPDDLVELTTRRGRARFVAQLTEGIRPDVVFAPFHWGGPSSANALTDAGALDPTSKMPPLKTCAVAVARVGPPAEHPAQVHRQSSSHRPSCDRQAPRTPLRTRRTGVQSTPRFLQGVFPISGEGLAKPGPLDPALRYTVPPGASAQALYFRCGNSTPELVYVLLLRDGEPMRWFPVGARSDVHVPLRVVEDLPGGTVVELHAAAPEGVTGHLVIDLGLVEV